MADNTVKTSHRDVLQDGGPRVAVGRVLNDLPEPASARSSEIPFSPLPVKRYEAAMPLLQTGLTPDLRPSSQTSSRAAGDDAAPALSLVLVVYNMPRQAMNTIYTLTRPYQRGVTDSDFEVIVIENASAANLDAAAVTAVAPNVSYHLRQETLPTPVFAANYGVEQARGKWVSVMVDGARMVTPGLVNYLLSAARITEHPVIATPSYHLGHRVQQKAMLEGYDENAEQKLLASVPWREDGYRLFDISCLSRTSMGGIFRPFGETNCVTTSRVVYHAVGGFDEAFDETGGGQANLDLYKRLVEHPDTQLIVLPGEGSFHQFHGGVTTGQEGQKRHDAMVAHFAQYAALRGGSYSPPRKRPIYFGAIPDGAVRFIRNSGNMLIDAMREEEGD